MPRTKSLKQLASEYEVHPDTLMRWLHQTFPHWYKPRREKGDKIGAKHPNKRTYLPMEIKLIYEHFGKPTDE